MALIRSQFPLRGEKVPPKVYETWVKITESRQLKGVLLKDLNALGLSKGVPLPN